MDLLLGILGALFIGGLSGWLAGLIMKTSYGIVINIILGMTGGLIGGWLLSLVNIGMNGLIITIIGSVLGAVILIFIIRFFKKKPSGTTG